MQSTLEYGYCYAYGMDTNYFYSMHVLDLVLLLSIADNSTRISGWVHLGQGDRKPYCSTSSWHSYVGYFLLCIISIEVDRIYIQSSRTLL